MGSNKVLFITNFEKINLKLETNKDIFEKLNQNFDNFYIVNWTNLIFFKKKKDEFNIKSKYKLFNPKSYNELGAFLEDGKNIIISDFIKHYASFGILYFLKKKNIKIIMFSDMGNLQRSPTYDLSHPILILKDCLKRKLYWYLVYFLFYLKIFTGVEVRFITNKKNLDNILKDRLKNFIYKKKLFIVKKLVLINSRSYDFFINNQDDVSEDYIVHLDYDLNYKDELEIRGKLSDDRIANHYFYLEKFLDKLSKDYNKKIVVCIHPLYDDLKLRKYLKKYEIYKYRTREFIYKSFIATHFSSSSIEDAIILKKRIIGLISNFATQNEERHTTHLAKHAGYEVVNIQQDYNYEKRFFLDKLDSSILNYDAYINNHHKLEKDKNATGSSVIIKGIKEIFDSSF
jgi:hypothetical protein